MQNKHPNIQALYILGKSPLFLTLFMFICTTGCFSWPKTTTPVQASPHVAETNRKPLAPIPILDRRIQALEQRLEEKEMSDEKRKAALQILNTYRDLKNASTQNPTSKDEKKLILSLFNSLALIDEQYFKTNENDLDRSPKTPILSVRELKRYKNVPGGVKAENDRHKTPVDLNSLLMEVESLMQTHEYERAGDLLSAAHGKSEAGPAREIIVRAMEQIKAEEKIFHLPEQINITDIEEIQKEVKRLIEKEKFEEAITRLDLVQNPSPENPHDPISELKQKAINSLINRERNRAAEFFLEAKKADDPYRKREMLYASREILTALILNYPEASLIHTLEKNLDVVDQTLRKIQETP